MLRERLKECRGDLGLSQAQVAKELFVSQQAYAKWENGDSTPNPETMKQLADLFDVSTDYLIGRIDTKEIGLAKAPDNIYKIEKRKIPVLGTIAAGTPTFAEQNFEYYVQVGAEIQADFCLQVKGDSMINARIQDGDLVFIRQQPTVNDGEIAAVLIDDEATLKRVYINENNITLVAENPAYKPLVYQGEEMNNVRILGKAVAFQSDVR